jgi:putative zinc finger/helix-turn-helix YgiT family protein
MSTFSHRYPRVCPACRQREVRPAKIERTLKVRYDGAKYEIIVRDLPVERCGHCGEVTFSNDADQAIDRALRDHIGLLHPEEIRANRKTLDLTQAQFAEQIGCAHETLSRWETGTITQSRHYDRMLRAYFHLPVLRDFLRSLSSNPDYGRTIIAPSPLAIAFDWGIPDVTHDEYRFAASRIAKPARKPSDSTTRHGLDCFFASKPRREWEKVTESPHVQPPLKLAG